MTIVAGTVKESPAWRMPRSAASDEGAREGWKPASVAPILAAILTCRTDGGLTWNDLPLRPPS